MNKNYYIIAFALLAAIILWPAATHGASISLFLDKNFYNAGDEFAVSLKIDSEGVNINAAQATLIYPADILEVKKVDKSGSVFDFWLEGPVFDNTAGKLSFIGGTSGGYSGKALNVFNIVFGVKKVGSAVLNLSNGAVTVSDGSGTNVLTGMRGADIVVAKENAPASAPVPITPPSAAPLPAGGAAVEEQPIALPPEILPKPAQITRTAIKAKSEPSAPKIEIPFYPNQELWYNAVANFLVKWNLPDDINAVATAVNSNPKFNPTKKEGLFDNKFFPALEDGIWYVHILFRNNVGWGDVGHYKISIDTEPPRPFNVRLEAGIDKNGATKNPAPTVIYKSADGGSGIAKYSVQIDGGTAIETQEEKMVLPVQKPGKHIIKVAAYDFAGNGAESRMTIDVLPIASPTITSITGEVFVGEGGLNIGGTSLPGTTIILALKSLAGETIAIKEIPVSEVGGFAARFDEALKKGIYFMEVVSRDSRGAESLAVKSNDIKVRPRPVLRIFGLELTANWFFALIIAILIFGFAIGFVFYHLWRTQLGRRVTIAERDVASVLDLVQKDIENIADKFEDGAMTKRKKDEAKFLIKRTAENIEKMEKYVLENIKQIKD